jgi:hypothetical protein
MLNWFIDDVFAAFVSKSVPQKQEFSLFVPIVVSHMLFVANKTVIRWQSNLYLRIIYWAIPLFKQLLVNQNCVHWVSIHVRDNKCTLVSLFIIVMLIDRKIATVNFRHVYLSKVSICSAKLFQIKLWQHQFENVFLVKILVAHHRCGLSHWLNLRYRKLINRRL